MLTVCGRLKDDCPLATALTKGLVNRWRVVRLARVACLTVYVRSRSPGRQRARRHNARSGLGHFHTDSRFTRHQAGGDENGGRYIWSVVGWCVSKVGCYA